MIKIAFAAAAAATLLTTAVVTSAKAQGVDVQIGRDRDDGYYRDRDYRDHRRYGSDATVGIGPGGVSIGKRCRMETTTIDRDDGRRITRRERRCD